MLAKLLELRDRATFVPVLCVAAFSDEEAERYLLGRVGFRSQAGRLVIIMTPLICGRKAEWDPVAWGDRTLQTCHRYISDNWAKLSSGDVVDARWVIGEKDHPTQSERLEDARLYYQADREERN